jgi:two-component system C4-dicarboxylate transport sensor histidine kinase DctB
MTDPLQHLKEFLCKLESVRAPETAITELRGIVSDLEAALESSDLERRRLAGQMTQSAKISELGTMTATLLHEMNQPLVAIKGLAELILDALKLPDLADLSTRAGEIRDQVQRLEDMQVNLSVFLRHEGYPAQPVQLASVLEGALCLFAARIEDLGVQVLIALPDGLPPLNIGRLHLSQILVNLLVNALDALKGQETRELRISAMLSDRLVRINCSNNGPPIPPEVRQDLFQPFFSTKGTNGTGLGLYISRALASGSGGSLDLQEPPEPGTNVTFSLILPTVVS